MEQVLYPLRDGWSYTELASLCKFENGDRGKNYPSRDAFVESGIPVINAGNLDGRKIVEAGLNYITRERYDILGSGKVRQGDLLFCLRGSLGKCAIVSNLSEGAIASSLVIVRPSEALDPNYLLYYFNSSLCATFIERYNNGAAQPNLSAKSLSKFLIPLASQNEQKRIVEKLDAMLSRIDTAIEHLQESVKLADALYASALNELATGVDGKKIKLGELGKIIRGSSPRPKGDPRYYGGSVPRLMVADVTRDGRYVTPEIDFLTDEGALKSRPVPKGTLTIQVSGNPGMPAILAVDACIHDGFAALIEIKQESISTEYLYFSLLAVAEQNNQMAVGAIFRNLTTSQLREIEVVIPGYEKQLELVKQMDIAEQKVKALKAELNVQLEAICQLRASILDSAFKGEL
ncbi:MAG: hypothetical protein CMH97_11915 [Oceanospirillaceae bacterium]|nr:hypothetical protein [Oceanospirillaceae bacterium]|tara:strand:+ start:587 stop:1798 length:1212 start_codon:yes stop_codon:yes gene_type:complete